jgi:hypothetical protein
VRELMASPLTTWIGKGILRIQEPETTER